MVTFTLPVYWTKEFKTKKDKKILLSLNWALNANHFEVDKAKKWYRSIVEDKIASINPAKLYGLVKATYIYNYKNEKSDLSNVIPVVSKFLLDALQDLDLIDEDNIKTLKQETSIVGEKTSEPHVVVIIENYEEDQWVKKR